METLLTILTESSGQLEDKIISFAELELELATVEQLAENRSHLVVVFFILAAFITPPDVISQFLLALPLMILYELSIMVGKVA
ncbi:MAG: twin-arginine translocase subunit TatC [Candidatus Poseidoniia archaeon]